MITKIVREAFKKKNYDYSDIVPISTDTHPPKGDRDSKYRDNIVDIWPPPLPPNHGIKGMNSQDMENSM